MTTFATRMPTRPGDLVAFDGLLATEERAIRDTVRAFAIARECRTILGGSGITTEYSPLRHAKNLESVLTYEGTVEVHTLSPGWALTDLNAFA